jgi:phytanoyl-CoA hydroxylase
MDAPGLVEGALDVDVAAILAHYRVHGWARVGRVFDDATLAKLRARADAIMLGEVTYPGLFFQRDAASGSYDDLEHGKGWQGPSLDYRKIEKLELDPLFWSIIESPVYEKLARAWIEGPIVIYRAVMFAKAANGGTPLPYHQDAGRFWGLDRDPTLQLWLALDDASHDAGCLEVVPGSHLGGLATPLGGVVPRASLDAASAEARVVAVPAQAGDVLLVHNHVWHRSGPNRTSRPRRALTVCYMTAATRCLRKKRAPRRFVPVFDGYDGV